MADNEIFTIKEMAAYLKLAEKTAYRLASEGNCRVLRWVVLGVSEKVKLMRG